MEERLSIWAMGSAHSPISTTAQTHCCTNTTAHGVSLLVRQSNVLLTSFDDPSVSPPSNCHFAFKGWSIRSLLFTSSSLFYLTLPLLHFFFFLFHRPPPFFLFVAFFRAIPLFFNTVCIHLKCVHVVLALSSTPAAGVSSAPEALSDTITSNAKHGRASQSARTFQQLWLSHLQKQSGSTSVSPLSFLLPDCGRLRPSISRQRCGPASWHLTEVMGINQKQIKPAKILYC